MAQHSTVVKFFQLVEAPERARAGTTCRASRGRMATGWAGRQCNAWLPVLTGV